MRKTHRAAGPPDAEARPIQEGWLTDAVRDANLQFSIENEDGAGIGGNAWKTSAVISQTITRIRSLSSSFVKCFRNNNRGEGTLDDGKANEAADAFGSDVAVGLVLRRLGGAIDLRDVVILVVTAGASPSASSASSNSAASTPSIFGVLDRVPLMRRFRIGLLGAAELAAC
jgi:hypothetical protein